MIPYGHQDITQDDINEVIKILHSEFLTQGPVVNTFENQVAAHVGAKHAIAVNSATSALHIACLSLGLKEGDSLWTSPISFVASANCGLYCGAKIDFVDIDPNTYNLCPSALEQKLINAEKKGNLPKIIVAVHLCGQPCDMAAIHALSTKYGFKIIEDASHAIGGKYRSEYIGNCRYSDVTVFSFHPVKIITTAEGGMALTNNDLLAERMILLKNHGITRDVNLMTQPSEGPWYYQQIDLGFNFRMTELQAALGCSQLNRLDQYVNRRHKIANNYNLLLRNFPVTTPWQHQDSFSAFHLYVIRLKLDCIKHTRSYVFQQMRAYDIGVNVHYIPIHLQPYYKNMGFKEGDFPEAEKYYSESITLPMFPQLREDQQHQISEALASALI